MFGSHCLGYSVQTLAVGFGVWGATTGYGTKGD